MIRTYRPTDRTAIWQIWNTVGTAMGYAPLTPEKLDTLLLKHPDFQPEHTFLLEEKGQVLGFVNGCTGAHIPKGTFRGYLSCLMLLPQADTPENTQALLFALEEAFRKAGRKECAVTCFDPIRLPWIIPGTDGHQHNNAPGVAVDVALNQRMQDCGYRETGRELAMYRSLADFTMPRQVLDKAQAMEAEGYCVARYDPKIHTGLTAMVNTLGNPLWDQEIPEAGKTGQNLLVGLFGNTCAGFTGPVYPEETGRGYFAGIGVAPQYQHHGLGKLLFYRLLQAEKEAGAAYMSLFTGQNNPAQNIYREAGFRVVRSFSVLLKEL